MAAFFLAVNLASGFGLGWWGVGILLPFAVVGPLYAVAWWRTTLDLYGDGIRVRGVLQQRDIPWESIKRFDIYPPGRRHLMMPPRIDQAVARLADGSNLRLRAIQPWRPITVFGLPKFFSRTEADDVVGWLNGLPGPSSGAAAMKRTIEGHAVRPPDPRTEDRVNDALDRMGAQA